MTNDFILVLDLGGPEAVRMARKLRAQHYYTEIISRRADIGLFRRKSPRGILIAGGEDGGDARRFPRAVLSLGVPVLALGGAARMLAAAEGAQSEGVLLRDSTAQIRFEPCPLFDGLNDSDRYFSRIDGFALPEGYRPVATTMDGLVPAFADFDRGLYALQFYPESNDPDGATMLFNFAEKLCGCTPTWTLENYVEEELRYIREKVGDRRAVIAVSGGVDSAACALLMRRAIGDALSCVMIDNGLLRTGEADQVLNSFKNDLGLDVKLVDAGERFLARLRGLTDPVEKHRAVHDAFIDVFSEQTALSDEPFLVKGTIYSDLLASGASDEAYARSFDAGQLLEPVRMLFKDEVRELGEALGLTPELAGRRPFPAPGLAVRCGGEVTSEKLEALRRADAIFRETVLEAGQDRRLSQYFAALTDDHALAHPQGYGWVCVLRAVSQHGASFSVAKLPYDLLDRASERILTEVPGIGRVAYDISGSACGAVEWQ